MKKTARRPLSALLLACACALALPAGAQNMKPGLWSLSNTVSSNDPQVQGAMSSLQQHLANLSPEQRQRMQQMMQQNGVQLDVGAGGALQTKICMTREMVERKEFPVQQGDCRQTYSQVAGNSGHVAFSCSKPRVSGEGELTLLSDTSYRAHMHIKHDEGAAQAVDMDVAGTWLSSDCGNLRPVPSPRTK